MANNQQCVSTPTATDFTTITSTITTTTFSLSTTVLPSSVTTISTSVCSTIAPVGTITTPATTCTPTVSVSTIEASTSTVSVPVTTTAVTTTTSPTSTLFFTSCSSASDSAPTPTPTPTDTTSSSSSSSSSLSSSSSSSPPVTTSQTTTTTVSGGVTNAPSTTNHTSSINTGAVIGGVAGGVGGAIVLFLLGWFIFRKKRRAADFDDIVWPDVNNHHEKNDHMPGILSTSDLNTTTDVRPYAYGAVASNSPTAYTGGYADNHAGGYSDYVPQNTYPPTAVYSHTPPTNQAAYAGGYAPHAAAWDHRDVGYPAASQQSPPNSNLAPRPSYSTAGHSSINSDTPFLAAAPVPAGYHASSGYNVPSSYPSNPSGYNANRAPSNASNLTQPLADVQEIRRPLHVVNDDTAPIFPSEKTQYRLHPDTGLTAVQGEASGSSGGVTRPGNEQRPPTSEKALAARRDEPEPAPDAPPAYSAD